MQAGRLPLILSLLIALVTGVLPLRECVPTDGCDGGLVAAGSHHHDDCDAGHHDSSHRHDAPHNDSSHPETGGSNCVESPWTVGVPGASRVVAMPPSVDGVMVASVLPAIAADASALADANDVARVRASIPLGIRSVVLLR